MKKKTKPVVRPDKPCAQGRRVSKPDKPYEGFPMFAHPCGYWAKKIRKRLVYFGKWADDPDGSAALERFNREWPYLKDGRTPPDIDVRGGCTVKQLCDAFLTSKEAKMNAGELSPRTFRDYYDTCIAMRDHFGRDRRVDDLRPDDFRVYRSKLKETRGTVGLKNEINRCHVIFKYASDNELIDRPVKFGQEFSRPSAKDIRRVRNQAGERMFERDELIRILKELEDNPQMRAMVLLGLNCGFGNSDCAKLPQSAVDFETGWIRFPRPKTEVPRRIPLWPETVAALKRAIRERPSPKDSEGWGLCFLTRTGKPWVRVNLKRVRPTDEPDATPVHVPIDAVGGEFGKTLHNLGINGRQGLGFYTLRHVFETIGGESKDQVAVDAIMGHVDTSMAGHYRERISDERLKAVTDTIHNWLFPRKGKKGGAR